MSFYDVNAANTANYVLFRVEPVTALERNAAIFGMRVGSETEYPHRNIDTSVSANEELAQVRTNLVVRALSQYAVPQVVRLAQDSASTGLSANAGSALIIGFETARTGIFANPAYVRGTASTPRQIVTNISDSVGVGGMSSPKTKNGLQALLDSLYNVSYDGGTTGPFGTLSASGAIVLPSARTSAGAPALSTAGGVTSGLTISFLDLI